LNITVYKSYAGWYCSAVTYATDEVYLPLCILIRLVAGCGAATLAVALMTTLLKATSYSTATIVVGALLDIRGRCST